MKTLAMMSLMLLAAPAFAQESKQKDPFVLPAGEITITDLIDACASYLEWNILYNDQEVTSGAAGPARTKLQRQIVTDLDGCEELLYGLLYRKGFAVTPIDPKRDVYEVIMMAGQRGREIANSATHKSNEEILARPELKAMVITVVKLNHINAQLANNALRPFFAHSGGGHAGSYLSIGNVGNRSSLLLQGFQDQVAQAIRMIRLCDVEQPVEGYQGQPMPQYVEKLEARIAKLEKRIDALLKKAK
ncbi:MAG: hypothetical protein ACE37K_18150 [Planctomycetota bacterium]